MRIDILFLKLADPRARSIIRNCSSWVLLTQSCPFQTSGVEIEELRKLKKQQLLEKKLDQVVSGSSDKKGWFYHFSTFYF